MIRLSTPTITDEEINEMAKVLKSGMLVQGNRVEEFETSLKNYMEVNYALAVSSGTAALHLALLALDIQAGDAVFVPAFTFPATVNVVEIQKARPVLIDVDSGTYNMNLDKLEEGIKNWKGPEKPKAIIVVHEFGAPCNMQRVLEIANKYNLYIIEDSACALGTTFQTQHAGTFGDIGCFSWHPRKAITTGEGGAVVTKSKQIYDRIKLLRNHGIHRDNNGKVDFFLPGLNYRLTDFQAALGKMQLSRFNPLLEKRKELAVNYLSALQNIPEVTLPLNIDGHSWQTFMIVLCNEIDRDSIIKSLYSKKIETNIGAQAIHMLAYYKEKYGYNEEEFPVAHKLYKNGLALPLYSELQLQEIQYVSKTLINAL